MLQPNYFLNCIKYTTYSASAVDKAIVDCFFAHQIFLQHLESVGLLS
jgi:hypothetical protein